MPHADTINLAVQVNNSIQRAGAMSFLTDATVAAADTVAGLRTAINAIRPHADQEPWKIMFLRVLDKDPNITDANVLALTTVAGLAALTGVPASLAIDVLE
jgi:hypothetical protein